MIPTKKILVTKFKHIGDVLLMTPLLRTLKEAYPGGKIIVAVNKGTEAVLKHNPDIDKLLVYDRGLKKKSLMEKFLGEWQFLQDIRQEKVDLCIELSGGDRGAILGILSGAKQRVGYAKGKKGLFLRNRLFTSVSYSNNTQKHMIIHNLDILKEIGIQSCNTDLVLKVMEQEKEGAKRCLNKWGIDLKQRLVIIHPTSRWLFKCWKDEYMAEISDYLVEKYQAKVIFTSSPVGKEVEKIENILAQLKYPVVNLAGKTSLRQLAALLEKSCLFIGIDSAPMHMAAALKISSIVLFGPSGYKNWGPLNKEAVVLSKELPCIPCGRAGCDDSKVSKCLDIITPQDVKEKIDKQFAAF